LSGLQVTIQPIDETNDIITHIDDEPVQGPSNQGIQRVGLMPMKLARRDFHQSGGAAGAQSRAENHLLKPCSNIVEDAAMQAHHDPACGNASSPRPRIKTLLLMLNRGNLIG
jgi:hypothetical protein